MSPHHQLDFSSWSLKASIPLDPCSKPTVLLQSLFVTFSIVIDFGFHHCKKSYIIKQWKYSPPQLVRHFNGLQSLLSTLRQARSGFCTNNATNNIFKQIPLYYIATNNISTQITLYNDISRETLFQLQLIWYIYILQKSDMIVVVHFSGLQKARTTDGSLTSILLQPIIF